MPASLLTHELANRWIPELRSTEAGALKPLTAAEVRSHPEFPHVLWDLKPSKKGTARVAKNRGGPINIAYEIHGHGKIRLVV